VKRLRRAILVNGCLAMTVLMSVDVADAQEPVRPAARAIDQASRSGVAPVTPPPGYVIGPEDQLSVLFWQDKEMSSDVVVRPDGKISLPLLNEIQASGLTPEELRQAITAQAKRFMQEPNATVIVRQINSRKVFITGSVEKPGFYPLNGPTTVLQLIAMAAGIAPYADEKNIVIIRNDSGRQATYKFDYKAVVAQKNTAQNIELKPGDTVVVP
jgi:polysaccharide export outer membrane protein